MSHFIQAHTGTAGKEGGGIMLLQDLGLPQVTVSEGRTQTPVRCRQDVLERLDGIRVIPEMPGAQGKEV